MAVCWRCPECAEPNCEDDATAAGTPLACDHCRVVVAPVETLCLVCDAPNPWSRRDSLHYVCRTCGNSQTYYSHLIAS